MSNDKHRYFKDDIRRVLFLYAIVPVVLLTLGCLLIFWGSWRYSLNRTNRMNNMQISGDLETTVESYIEVIEDLALQTNLLDGEIEVGARVNIFERIYDISNRLGYKANLYMFDQELTPIISATKSVPNFLDGKYFANWGVFRLMSKNQKDIAFKLVEDDSEVMHLVIGKAMVEDDKTKGFVVFVLDSRQFHKVIANMDSQTVITDEYGWIYASNNYNFLDRMDRFELNGGYPKGDIEHRTGTYYFTSNAILKNHIYIYSISPLSNQIAVFKLIFIILLFVFAMMILFILISTKKMAVKKTKDLYTIIGAFEKVKEGDLNTYIEISSNDEFAVISESYNLMLISLKEQIERNKEMGRLVVASQSKQLESQFNPHFLFNTLENIRFMCKLDPDSASKMILNLSTLLHYSISNVKEEVTVKEDITYTENYMSILKYRFNKRFHYKINIPQEVDQCIILKLIVQPMIENSIKYGFEGKEQLYVEVSASIETDNLVLTCSDDGAGMKPEVLNELNLLMKQKINKSNHFGLYNIHRRIQLKFGDEYGIQINSKQGYGTNLKVVLPILYRDMGGQEC